MSEHASSASGSPSVLFIILVAILIAAAIYVATKLSGRTIAFILGGGFFLLFFSYFAFRAPHQEMVPAVEARVAAPNLETASELWDKLTKARIQLDDVEENGKPSIKIEDEEKLLMEAGEQGTFKTDEPAKPPRPAWVDWPPKRVGNVYRQVVVSDRYSTVEECFSELEDRFQGVVQVRMRSLMSDQPSSPAVIPRPAKFGIGLDYIMSEICREEYTETVSSSVGEMRRVHVLMEFDTAIDNHLRASWRRHERFKRLAAVGGFSGLALAALSLVYGLLKFDTWTRGYYTKRLLIGVPAAIIVLVLLLGS